LIEIFKGEFTRIGERVTAIEKCCIVFKVKVFFLGNYSLIEKGTPFESIIVGKINIRKN
jgi:hypothetical protein